MLGRLARWLRLLGADVLYDTSIGGAAMMWRARADGRVFLTRDKRLRTATDAVFIQSDTLREQLRQVLGRFPFDFEASALTRCTRCNQRLRPVARELVARRVPPFVFASQEAFAQCDGCGRIYWNATHPERIRSLLTSLGLLR